jgi:hypothetical protein
VPVPPFAALAAWADPDCRAAWLDAPGLVFEPYSAGECIAGAWPDGTRMEVRVQPRGPQRCRLLLSTWPLGSAAAARKAGDYWRLRLARLCRYLGI